MYPPKVFRPNHRNVKEHNYVTNRYESFNNPQEDIKMKISQNLTLIFPAKRSKLNYSQMYLLVKVLVRNKNL